MEISEERRLELGDAAKMLKEHPLTEGLFKSLTVELFDRFSKAAPGDTQALIAIQSELKGISAFQERLTVLMNDAAMIRHQRMTVRKTRQEYPEGVPWPT